MLWKVSKILGKALKVAAAGGEQITGPTYRRGADHEQAK